MSNIIIHPVNEAKIKIECEYGPARELQDYFTFVVPNANYRQPGKRVKGKFPKYKWNGKISLLKLRSMELLRGLIPYVEEFAKDRNYTISYSDPSLTKTIPITEETLQTFITSLNLHSDGVKIEPYDYQFNSVLKAIQNKRLLIVSPTASGKSLCIYLLVRSLLHIKGKILVIVPTTNLVRQLYSDFSDYSSHNGWVVENNVTKIYANQDKNTSKKVFISTWQSMVNMDPDYLAQFSVIIADEAHTCQAKSLEYVLGNCINAKYRIGMTGTLDDVLVHKLTIEGLLGLMYKPTTAKELMDRNLLSKFEINCVILNHGGAAVEDYRDELEYLISDPKRNKFICNLAMSLEKNTLILFNYIAKHGDLLKEMFDQVKGKRPVYYIHGKIEAEVREQVRAILEKEHNSIILASFGTWSIGNNVKNLHNIIFASPLKAKIRTLQSIGRGLRLHETKEKCMLYDISDDLRFQKGDKPNFTLDHFAARLKIYHDEEFPFSIYRVKLK
jgi:superfamily II DNA or RNA helicase